MSPSGSSATVAMTPEKKKRGSGLYGRTWTILPLFSEAVTHAGVTTGIMNRSASV